MEPEILPPYVSVTILARSGCAFLNIGISALIFVNSQESRCFLQLRTSPGSKLLIYQSVVAPRHSSQPMLARNAARHESDALDALSRQRLQCAPEPQRYLSSGCIADR